MMYLLLGSLALLYFCLFLLALQKVHGSGDRFEFIYGWGFIVGAYVWEDVIVFAPLFLAMALLTLLTQDLRIGLLCFLVFWVVRSLGETVYFFLEQFLEPKVMPHNIRRQLEMVSNMFGGIATQKAYILMQIMFQTVTVTGVVCIILLLQHWQTVPVWIY